MSLLCSWQRAISKAFRNFCFYYILTSSGMVSFFLAVRFTQGDCIINMNSYEFDI